jgi:hypothetical protein
MPPALRAADATMRENFHESYGHTGVKRPSDRSTGLVFSGVVLILAVWWRNHPVVPWVALGVAGALAASSLAMPQLLRPLNLVWFQIGLVLHRIVSPVVMFAMFGLVFLPAGLIMRLWHDPLRSRRTGQRTSYWIERAPAQQCPASMANQF